MGRLGLIPALAEPESRKRVAELGAIPLPGNAVEFDKMLAVETDRWRKIVKPSGVTKG